MVSVVMLVAIMVITLWSQDVEAKRSTITVCTVSSNPIFNIGHCVGAVDGDSCSIFATQGPACSGTSDVVVEE